MTWENARIWYVQKKKYTYETDISGLHLIQICCSCHKRRWPMRHGTKAQINQGREENASDHDMV
jgi:hypothetical protein